MIKHIKEFIKRNELDGYIIPKNDHYFTEYSEINNLSKVSNFTGSAGFALILVNKNYLFVDGRYTLQAKKEAGKNFKILEIPFKWPKDLVVVKDKKIGFDPKLFTKEILFKYFENKVNLIPISYKFKNRPPKKIHKFFNLKQSIIGETSNSKIKKISNFLNKKKIDYLYVSASENVNWLLNIRGKDLPNSPLANCKLIITKNKKLFFFSDLNKASLLKNGIFNKIFFLKTKHFFKTINSLANRSFCIDKNTCSLYEETILKTNFKIVSYIDPIYQLKSIKNKTEITHTQNAHIKDGVALTKFLYWFKHRKKATTEKKVEKKLEQFRKISKDYMYPSFDTIAGSGPNGAIIHYKSNNLSNRKINKNDLLLIDSGGQYKWGTTDVTRTISSGKVPQIVKNNFTRVLKGHMAVINCDLKKNYNGFLIDKLARKYLLNVGLDYSHGTGHGVGFFLNVHEGPQAISKYNNVTLKKGMILSNEPGYYKKNSYGIRIENLIFVDRIKNKLIFRNLTYAPIDMDLVNFEMLTNFEKRYLFDYHLDVYFRISKFLNRKEKKWLVSLIN